MGGRAPEDVAPHLRLSFVAPGRPLSINELKGKHWGQVHRTMRPWKEAAQWAWKLRSAEEKKRVRCTPCDVRVTLPFRTKAHRDPSNYVDTVVKAIIDGLKDDYATTAGQRITIFTGVWPDDTPEWVSVSEPVCAVGTQDVLVDLIPR